jgi:hypothetical protein
MSRRTQYKGCIATCICDVAYLAAAAPPSTALRLFLRVGLGLLARLAFLASLAASNSLVVGFVYTAVEHSTVVLYAKQTSSIETAVVLR